jgi:hypothetical protein
MKCQSCQLVRINGVLCHEAGCPDAWRSYKRYCAWCGSEFMPEDRGQQYCSDDCYCIDNGLPYETESDSDVEDYTLQPA